MSMRMILLAMLLTGCEFGAQYETTQMGVTCKRPWLLSTARSGSFYCNDIFNGSGIDCFETNWGHRKGDDPNFADHHWDHVIWNNGDTKIRRVAEDCK